MENEIIKSTKYSVVIKQTSKGQYYLGHVRVNAETLEEMESSIDSALKAITKKIDRLNSGKVGEKKAGVEVKLSPEDEKLFKTLKSFRFGLSEKEDIPAYMIFHDSVLENIAKQRPKTKEELLQISGVGTKKYDKYGEETLKIVNQFTD
jgi:ATP-dependent DNA helicase RecQ